MSDKYRVHNPEGLYFITTTVTAWVDLFIRPVYKHILIDSLNFCSERKGLNIHAYAIMTSHFHAIVSSKQGFALQDTVRDMKKHTSKELVKAIIEYPESRREWMLEIFSNKANSIKRGVNYKVWQDYFHPIELLSNEMIEQRLDYIHKNPIVEEIVREAVDYKYSSAYDYAGGIGDLKLDKL